MSNERDDLPNLGLLIKLMQMTKSDRDNEALMAIRKANQQLEKFGGDWEKLLTGKVTVIGDPFASVSAPAPKRNAPPPPQPRAQTATQMQQTAWRYRKPQPQPTPPPTQPKFNPAAAQPAQPSPAMPNMSFAKTADGHFRVRSNKRLVVGDHYEIPTRNGGLRRVKITAVDVPNQYGDSMYFFTNAPLNVGDFL